MLPRLPGHDPRERATTMIRPVDIRSVLAVERAGLYGCEATDLRDKNKKGVMRVNSPSMIVFVINAQGIDRNSITASIFSRPVHVCQVLPLLVLVLG